MKVTNKQIEELNQLDRIEYKLEREKINDWSLGIVYTVLMWFLSIVGYSFIIFFITQGTINEASGLNLISRLFNGIKFMFYVSIPLIILHWAVEYKKLKKLNNKFFRRLK